MDPPHTAWRIDHLDVVDVRCWTRVSLDLPDGLVVVCGPNGSGKTSLVEAIVLATMGVSPRTPQLAELVRHGREALRVAADVHDPTRSPSRARREIGFAPGLGRRLMIDGVAVRQLATWRAPGSVLVFLPDELRSVKGPPAARRRALDRLLEAIDPAVGAALVDHQRALTQRNALLRRIRAGTADARGLDPWDQQLATLGAAIIVARRRTLAEITDRFAYWLHALGGRDGGRLELESSSDLAAVEDAGVEDALRDIRSRTRAREIAAGMTLGGPHRDDVWMGTGDHDLRRLGSQGEQRTAALALLLAHRDRLRDAGVQPILLLDDVLSELDPDRRAALLRSVEDGGQTVLTAADPEAHATAGARNASVVSVRDGALV
ncbi:MAG: DNA replication and repair protein RecF [Thermoleophilia bacterium]